MKKTSMHLAMTAGLVFSLINICSAKVNCDPKSSSGSYLAVEPEDDGGLILKIYSSRLKRSLGIESGDYNNLEFTQNRGNSFTLKDEALGFTFNVNEASGVTSTLVSKDENAGDYTCTSD